MVALILRLKVQLLANTFRRSRWQVLGIVLALSYGTSVASTAVATLIGLRFAGVASAAPIVVVLGSLVTLAFFLIPLAVGSDDTLDPRRFSHFGFAATRLAGALALAAVVGVPGLVIAIVAFAQIFTWGRTPFAVGVALCSAILIVASCLLASRVSTAIGALLLSTRRAREACGLITLVVLVVIGATLALHGKFEWRNSSTAVLAQSASLLGWTPLGAMWSAPAAAASGNQTEALQKLLAALFSTALLAMVWRQIVAKVLVTPQREGRVKSYRGVGWFDRLPATPLGAIAARSFTYWGRDARYRVQLVVVPIVPMLMVAVLAVGGIDSRMLTLLPLPVMCLFLSWLTHNDVAYDSTAIWAHMVAHTSGGADRVGRLIPVLVVGVVLIAVGGPLSAAVSGQKWALPVVVGVSVCILLSGLGFSSISSARFPYAAVHSGDSPFAQPQSSGGLASLVQSAAFFATVFTASPSIVLGWRALNGEDSLGAGALFVGTATGIVVLIAGVVVGGRSFDRRGPELLAFAQRS